SLTIFDDVVENSNKTIDEKDLLEIGRKGEELVYKYLKDIHRQYENVSIKWLNENVETGSPYDIEINFTGATPNTHRIEVKTTTKHVDNYQFSISIQEIDEILKYPDTYYIYRVNLKNHSLIILDNIKLNLSNKQQLELKINVLTTNDSN
ncbi:unnamed protein product, partial [Rotaria magnacalcarata]